MIQPLIASFKKSITVNVIVIICIILNLYQAKFYTSKISFLIALKLLTYCISKIDSLTAFNLVL